MKNVILFDDYLSDAEKHLINYQAAITAIRVASEGILAAMAACRKLDLKSMSGPDVERLMRQLDDVHTNICKMEDLSLKVVNRFFEIYLCKK